jgi:hypothetical protein
MHLSISSSESDVQQHPAVELSPLPMRFERPIPFVSWTRMVLLTSYILFVLLVAWEFEMRRMGLQPGDLDDGRGYWAVERRKVDSGPRDSVVIVGDSRILFDTDLAAWQRLTGRRPIQLALMGGNAQPILHDLANDEHFAGLLVIGTAEFSYFADPGPPPEVIRYKNSESPSQRSGIHLYRTLSRYCAFLDSNYTLFSLLGHYDWPERNGVHGPYMGVWKIAESYDDRQSYLWQRIEHDDYLREHARRVWITIFTGPPVTTGSVEQISTRTKSDIDRIRARGGEVVWIRPPSSGPLLEIERVRYPRQKVWDRLLQATSSFGIFFEDYPAMQHLRCPDGSHLSKSSAVAFTEAYVRVLREHVGFLRDRAVADSTRASE